MIIAGSGLTLAHTVSILNDRVRDSLSFCGRAPTGLSVSCRLTKKSDFNSVVWIDYGSKACSFASERVFRYQIDVTVTTARGHIVHNERAVYILAKHGVDYVDCWNLGSDTSVRVIRGDEAICDVTSLATYDCDLVEFFNDHSDLMEDLIDGINECKSQPETCGPIGCPGHQSATDITGNVS